MKTFTKPQKILAVMYELSQGNENAILYEDIVVRAFERYPQDFQLRGYPQYPDSSDIHKPLYAMKKKGFIRSANKTFELTPLGFEIASKLVHSEKKVDKERLTKQEEHEIRRILSSACFQLYTEGVSESILDTDFYEYLGVTVRTSNNDFKGRLSNVDNAIIAYCKKNNDAISLILKDLHQFLKLKFEKEIKARDIK